MPLLCVKPRAEPCYNSAVETSQERAWEKALRDLQRVLAHEDARNAAARARHDEQIRDIHARLKDVEIVVGRMVDGLSAIAKHALSGDGDGWRLIP